MHPLKKKSNKSPNIILNIKNYPKTENIRPLNILVQGMATSYLSGVGGQKYLVNCTEKIPPSPIMQMTKN